MKVLVFLLLLTTSCATNLVAGGDQVFLSKEAHPNYTVKFLPDSEILPTMFKVTPKQKAMQIINIKCPSGHKVTAKSREMETIERLKATYNYQLISFKCK